MAEQICPKCKHESFNWSYDDESTPHTYWGCWNCKYSAVEDESLERVCKDCNLKTELRLEDDEQVYWWCSQCGKTTIRQDKA